MTLAGILFEKNLFKFVSILCIFYLKNFVTELTNSKRLSCHGLKRIFKLLNLIGYCSNLSVVEMLTAAAPEAASSVQ